MLAEPTQRHHIVVVPDVETQAQPSGRTSELTFESLADLLQLLCSWNASASATSIRRTDWFNRICAGCAL
jgi:hypothetical protein